MQCGHVPYLSVPELMGLGWFLPFVGSVPADEHSGLEGTSPGHMAVHTASRGACTPSVSEGPLLHRLPTLAALCCQPPEDVG